MAAADNDGDGVPNAIDGYQDSDGDGLANYLDPDGILDTLKRWPIALMPITMAC